MSPACAANFSYWIASLLAFVFPVVPATLVASANIADFSSACVPCMACTSLHNYLQPSAILCSNASIMLLPAVNWALTSCRNWLNLASVAPALAWISARRWESVKVAVLCTENSTFSITMAEGMASIYAARSKLGLVRAYLVGSR